MLRPAALFFSFLFGFYCLLCFFLCAFGNWFFIQDYILKIQTNPLFFAKSRLVTAAYAFWPETRSIVQFFLSLQYASPITSCSLIVALKFCSHVLQCFISFQGGVQIPGIDRIFSKSSNFEIHTNIITLYRPPTKGPAVKKKQSTSLRHAVARSVTVLYGSCMMSVDNLVKTHTRTCTNVSHVRFVRTRALVCIIIRNVLLCEVNLCFTLFLFNIIVHVYVLSLCVLSLNIWIVNDILSITPFCDIMSTCPPPFPHHIGYMNFNQLLKKVSNFRISIVIPLRYNKCYDLHTIFPRIVQAWDSQCHMIFLSVLCFHVVRNPLHMSFCFVRFLLRPHCITVDCFQSFDKFFFLYIIYTAVVFAELFYMGQRSQHVRFLTNWGSIKFWEMYYAVHFRRGVLRFTLFLSCEFNVLKSSALIRSLHVRKKTNWKRDELKPRTSSCVQKRNGFVSR